MLRALRENALENYKEWRTLCNNSKSFLLIYDHKWYHDSTELKTEREREREREGERREIFNCSLDFSAYDYSFYQASNHEHESYWWIVVILWFCSKCLARLILTAVVRHLRIRAIVNFLFFFFKYLSPSPFCFVDFKDDPGKVFKKSTALETLFQGNIDFLRKARFCSIVPFQCDSTKLISTCSTFWYATLLSLFSMFLWKSKTTFKSPWTLWSTHV